MYLTTLSCAFTLYLLLISSHCFALLSRCFSTMLGILLLRLHSFSPFDLTVNKTSHCVYSSIQAQSTLTFLLPLPLLVTHHVSSSITGHELSLTCIYTRFYFSYCLTGIDIYFRFLVSTVRLAGEYCSELMTSLSTHAYSYLYLYIYSCCVFIDQCLGVNTRHYHIPSSAANCIIARLHFFITIILLYLSLPYFHS